MDPRRRQALADLGFHAAELRTIADLLSRACVHEDLDSVCDHAQALIPYCRDLPGLYVKLLSIAGPEHLEPPLRLVPDQSASL